MARSNELVKCIINKTRLSTCLLAGAFATLPAVAAADTLQQAVEQAVRQNAEVRAAANRRLAANEGLRQARAGYLPRVDVVAGVGRVQYEDRLVSTLVREDITRTQRDASLTLSQMLFDGLGVRSEVARQQARIESGAFGVAATAEDVALRAAAAYLEVLRRQETVIAATENLTAHQRYFGQIKRLAEGGVGRQSDVDQTHGRLASAKALLRAEESSLRDAKIAYLRLVGSAPGELVKPNEAPSLSRSEDDAVTTALANHPAVRAAQADVDIATAQRGVVRAALSPRLDLELSANRTRNEVNGTAPDMAVMLKFRYNLFRGGVDQARIAEAGYLIEEANENLNRTRGQISENVAMAYNAYVSAQDRREVLQQYVESGMATREAYVKQFQIGQRSLVDLLNAENEYFNARFAFITAEYTALTSALRIHAGMGQLLPMLGIPVPIEASLVNRSNMR